MNTTQIFKLCVSKSPMNETLKLVAADAIAEEIGDYDKALIEVNKIAEITLKKRADRREKYLLRGTTKQAILNQLAEANGRRRERTLSYEDVIHCIKRARKNGWHAIGGGRVANAYKYPAYQTACLVVVRSDNKIVVQIATISAKKGSSLTNPFCGLTINATTDQFREWANNLTERLSA